MKIHVTGYQGFIAQHLMRQLQERGHQLVGTGADYYSDPENALEWEPEIVVHLGAVVSRQAGEVDPLATINYNAASTTLWAKACAEREIRFFYSSTSEVYGDLDGNPAREYRWHQDRKYNGEGPLGDMELPYNLYGLTKRWGEEGARLYTDPTNLTIVRLSMPYGPGHPPGSGRAALTNFLWDALHGKPLTVHEGAARSWCWVGDTVEALVLLIEGGHSGIYNVGRDDNEASMEDVALMALRLVMEYEEKEYDEDWAMDQINLVPAPANQVVVKRLPTDRIRALGWEPQVELRQGMAATLAWLVASAEESPAPVLPL